MAKTKRALLTSGLALLLCMSMLIGSTYAWFTDSVTSAGNRIQSGTLDIILEYSTDGGNTWEDAENKTLDFKTADNRSQDEILWEPGCTYELPLLRVRNNGNLALKYQITISGVVGDAKLLEAIDFTTKVGTAEATAIYSFEGYLNEKDDVSENILISGHMKENAGNEYQGLSVDGISITVFATQQMFESDSFDYTYDASSAVKTIAEAEALMANNEAVVLLGCNEPDGILNIPAAFTNTLTLVNSELKSVQAEKDANIIVIGNVTINAKGTAAVAAIAEEEDFDGSAISVNGKLNLSGNGTLTAIAADVNGAAGIGGMNATDITVRDITIANVRGSYAYGVGSDTKYYKDAPEGGAAIGSGYNGATIALDNVTVLKAIGGSKAAGIGARYHTGVTVTVKDSTIGYVEGGVSAAGIGGSRVSGDLTESGTTINITNSTITAKGGAYGAGIGSGYDTHCASDQPMCTINITDSTINAEGGQYAAGVGTGYHNAALNGEIKNSTVNAVSGEKFYKDSYTQAQDVGFGVVDPAREGQQINSYIIYNGTAIRLSSFAVVADADALTKALSEGKTELYLASGEFQLNQTLNDITIIGSKGTEITNCSKEKNDHLVFTNLTVENVEFTTNAINAKFDGACVMRDCTFTTAAGSNAFRWAYVEDGGSLLIQDSTFDLANDYCAIQFDGNDNGTILMERCVFNTGYMAFSAGMNVQIKDSALNGTWVSGYGDILFTNCDFDSNCKLYFNASCKVDGVFTINESSVNGVEGHEAVSNVCFDAGCTKDWKFVIDGVTYDTNSVADRDA